ncbi:ABC transporter permease [Coxiella endosymbiont of Amblyomma americanum]|uniref:ABC transporter permease n=1 Tax=Coxiella endosymbiont of Amblyomma americanum TaxID=325775 RepID=UPI00058203F7|nr:ABC transporter permease subunit [Coxiella endosymbiont of Amblyomma americanum]AJC50180.1 sulfonate ABC transporter permease [Coxiella endosymbiont of Amblyomma americanum]AUJ58540.1 sulfonate ABC transporter permease [Coxiella-like endosymbiont of Amblyomma americanum]
MLSFSKRTYIKSEITSWPIPNYWDVVALLLVAAILILLGYGANTMMEKFDVGKQPFHISLDPIMLPYYALRTVLRMLISMFFSLLFTFTFGTWAAKSRHAERIIIPMIDILQSVPVLGFLTITVSAFVAVFHGSLLGPECAALFAIFTAQVWNIALSFYQSLKTVPNDLQEAAVMLQLSAWQRFWKVEVPFAIPGLLWNVMMSMSGSWIFLVASEVITVAGHSIMLQGIGSYINLAIKCADKMAVIYVIIAMIIVIALYDQLIFRPLIAWAEKYNIEVTVGENEVQSWILNLFHRTRFLRFIGEYFSLLGNTVINSQFFRYSSVKKSNGSQHLLRRFFIASWYISLILVSIISFYLLTRFILSEAHWAEIFHVLCLGFITGLRVSILLILSSFIWVPVGVWIGLRPNVSQVIQPIVQFLAAFPANLLFPIMVMLIIRFTLNVNIWTSPLMILGAQWYILFNVIAGTMALPKNLHHVIDILNVKGWLWWKRFILPGIFPYYITGAITTAGSAWNTSIIAESVNWGRECLHATGLGTYIVSISQQGDFPRLVLAIMVMSLYVLIFNYGLWRPLYRLAEERFQVK